MGEEERAALDGLLTAEDAMGGEGGGGFFWGDQQVRTSVCAPPPAPLPISLCTVVLLVS